MEGLAVNTTSVAASREAENDHHGNYTQSGFNAQADVFPIVLAVLIIVLNSLVILLVFKHKQLRNTTNYLLCSLALSDLLTGLLSIPFYISCNVLQGVFICIVAEVVLRFTSISTVLHLISITIDRYLAVMHSLRYHNIVTRCRGIRTIASTWFISVAVALIQLVWINLGTITNTHEEPPESLKQHEIRYDIFNMVVFFGFPLIIMTFVNGKVFYEVIRQSSLIRKSFPGWERKKQTQKREWKAALTFSIMFAVFILCWFPYFMIRLQHNLGNEEMFVLPNAMEYAFVNLRFLTSFLNPCIYILGKNDFRNAIKGREYHRASMSKTVTGSKSGGAKTTLL